MKHILMTCLLLFGIQAYAQKTIRLQNKETGEAIADAHYFYQNQSGISSKDGSISIKPIPDVSLLISHVNYGKVGFDSDQLSEAIKSGVLT